MVPKGVGLHLGGPWVAGEEPGDGAQGQEACPESPKRKWQRRGWDPGFPKTLRSLFPCRFPTLLGSPGVLKGEKQNFHFFRGLWKKHFEEL